MKLGSYLNDRAFFYLMHLSYGTGQEDDREEHWDYARRNKLIGLDKSEVNRNWNKLSESRKKSIRSRFPNWFRHFEMFCNEMQKGDLVVAVNGMDSILGVGIILERRYYYRKELSQREIFFDHVRKVRWSFAKGYDKRIFLSEQLQGFRRTLIKVKRDSPFWKKLRNVNLS